LPSAENNERLQPSVKPSPLETANCLSGNIAVEDDCFFGDTFLRSLAAPFVAYVVISHNSIRIYN
jgi:hypothetical protein